MDTSTGQTRISELTVRAGGGGGLAPADLPPMNLELLIRALTAPAPALALPTSDEPAAGAEPAAAAVPGPAQTGLAGVEPAVVDEPAAVVPRRVRKAGAAKKAAVKKAGPAKKATGKKVTAKAAAASRRRVAAEAVSATAGGARAYRRMPEAEQVMDVYGQTGSITGVAEHFGVPRHTIAGWARRLRAMGHTIGRQ